VAQVGQMSQALVVLELAVAIQYSLRELQLVEVLARKVEIHLGVVAPVVVVKLLQDREP
jgi:hypothetical protein